MSKQTWANNWSVPGFTNQRLDRQNEMLAYLRVGLDELNKRVEAIEAEIAKMKNEQLFQPGH